MSDQASSVAFDPSAPQAERVQALGELQKSHMPSVADIAPDPAIAAFVQQVAADMEMAKAINPNVVPFPSKRSKDGEPGMQSVYLDNFQLQVNGDFWERPGMLSFDSLRQMVEQTPVLNAVILTRIRQVQRFCRIADSGIDLPGFQIVHVDRNHQLTAEEQESIQLLQKFFSNCGWEFKPRKRKAMRRDAFGQFMAKAVRDTLTMDSFGIELEWKRDKALGLDGFYAVDGATIRLCTEDGYRGDDEVFALQVVEGRVTTAYTFDDLVYEPRNPRSDVRAAGYGISETELLVRVVTGFLNAMSYNIKGFDQNAIPKGILHLSGNYDQNDVAAFKRYWNSMVRGVDNRWSLPVMVSKDQESKASFESLGVEYNEMHFSKWMTFLTSIICAIYGMSPTEINFDAFSGGGTSPLAGSDTAEKLSASKDSGLRPLLSYFENLFTDYIASEFSDKYAFRWTGLDPEDQEKKHELRKLVSTVDEIRAQEGMEKHPDPSIGNAPVNPSLVGLYQAAMQQGQQNDFGQPGDDDQGGEQGDEQGQQQGQQQDDQAGGEQGQDFGGEGDFGGAQGGDFGQQGQDFGKSLIYEIDL